MRRRGDERSVDGAVRALAALTLKGADASGVADDRVVDESLRPVRDGEPGELLVRPQRDGLAFLEYVDNPDATADAWHDGWFRTRDRGRLEDAWVWIDGRLGEPTPHAPLGVIGVDALLRAATERPDELLRRIRTTLHGGKEYFQWKQIPVVFLVRGSLDYSPNDGLSLRHEDEEWSLSPLLGKNFTAAKPGTMGWWWTPQFG